jgi:hypothetical protein
MKAGNYKKKMPTGQRTKPSPVLPPVFTNPTKKGREQRNRAGASFPMVSQ